MRTYDEIRTLKPEDSTQRVNSFDVLIRAVEHSIDIQFTASRSIIQILQFGP